MTTYAIKVWYAATPEDGEPQTHTGLTADQAEMGGGAFLSDLVHLGGEGVRRLVVEVEGGESSD